MLCARSLSVSRKPWPTAGVAASRKGGTRHQCWGLKNLHRLMALRERCSRRNLSLHSVEQTLARVGSRPRALSAKFAKKNPTSRDFAQTDIKLIKGGEEEWQRHQNKRELCKRSEAVCARRDGRPFNPPPPCSAFSFMKQATSAVVLDTLRVDRWHIVTTIDLSAHAPGAHLARELSVQIAQIIRQVDACLRLALPLFLWPPLLHHDSQEPA